jgi:hypothetical protein
MAGHVYGRFVLVCNYDESGIIGVVEAEPPHSRGIAATGRLFPVLLPSEWCQVEIVVCSVEQIDPARGWLPFP